MTCHECNEKGHYASQCPNRSAAATGTTLVQHDFSLAQGSAPIDPQCILLDSQSTVSVFRNPRMLSNIRPSGHVLRVLTNGGSQDSQLIGDLPNLGPV